MKLHRYRVILPFCTLSLVFGFGLFEIALVRGDQYHILLSQ